MSDTENKHNAISSDGGTYEACDRIIYLIRHAESQNNVAKRDAYNAWRRIRTFSSFPTRSEWYSISTLLAVPMNTDLSSDGEHMIKVLQGKLRDINFLQSHNIELIVHSPLLRAHRTCLEIFEDLIASSDKTVPIIQHPDIFEKNISEHAGLADLSQRTVSFIQWLLARPEKCIVVVGHSAFFRNLLAASLIASVERDESENDKKVESANQQSNSKLEANIDSSKESADPINNSVTNSCSNNSKNMTTASTSGKLQEIAKMTNCEVRRVCLTKQGVFHSPEIVHAGGTTLLTQQIHV